MKTETIPVDKIEKKKSNVLDWILLIASIFYAVSPVDIVPDVPVIGWVDDFFFLAATTVNLIQSYVKDKQGFMFYLLRMLKIGLIIMGVIAVGIIILIVLGIISLFK